MIRLLFKSRYFRIALGVILAGLILLGAAAGMYVRGNRVSEEEISSIREWGAEIAIPFGEYRDIKLVDGETAVVAAKNRDGSWEIRDVDDDTRVTVAENGYFLGTGGGYVFLDIDDKVTVVNAQKSLDAGKAVYPEDKKACKNAYYDEGIGCLALETESDFMLFDEAESLIYRGAGDSTMLVIGSGYVSEGSMEEGYKIKNIYTKEVEHELPPGEAVDGYFAGHWVISVSETPDKVVSQIHYYVLDRNFDKVEEAGEFNSYLGDSEHLYVQKEFPEDMLINRDGRVVLSQEKGDSRLDYRGTAEGWVIVSGDSPNTLRYVKLSGENEGAEQEREELCTMDFDEGIALAGLAPGTGEGTVRDLIHSYGEGYKLGFVNESFEHLTDFIFDRADQPENGYTAVAIGKQWALLDLKGVASNE